MLRRHENRRYRFLSLTTDSDISFKVWHRFDIIGGPTIIGWAQIIIAALQIHGRGRYGISLPTSLITYIACRYGQDTYFWSPSLRYSLIRCSESRKIWNEREFENRAMAAFRKYEAIFQRDATEIPPEFTHLAGNTTRIVTSRIAAERDNWTDAYAIINRFDIAVIVIWNRNRLSLRKMTITHVACARDRY